MEKKDKNSLLNIHYSRTLTPDNLSKAANYVGEYVLKGLGTLGRFLNAGFTSPTYGTTGQVSYARNAEDAKRLRELSKASEQAMGKAMTWVSPLNYGAALMTGNGLNARKGEEEVASWSPAWQAAARLGELYVGPKGVKVAKAAPRAVVNTAAKAGVKPAKAAMVTREIKLGIKLNTKNGRMEVTDAYFNSPDKWYRVSERPEKIGIEQNGKNVTTSDDPGTNGTINGWRESMLSLTGRVIPGKGSNEGYFIFQPRKISLSKHGAAHGNTSQAAKGQIWLGTFAFSDRFPIGIIEGQAPMKIFRGMNEAGKDSRTNFVLQDWDKVPLGARIGFHTGEMPMSNLGWFQKTNKGTYTYESIIPEKRISYQPKLLLDSPTSLAFFERKPAKITEAERLGIPKGDRGNLSLNLKLAIEDLALYKNSGLYRQIFRVTPDWEDFGWNLNKNNPTFMLLFAADGEVMKGPFARVLLLTPTGKGVVAWNPVKNMGGYSSRSFTIPEGMNWAPGEANMMLDGVNGLKVILTAPKTDFFDAVVEESSKHLGENLSNTIDKNIMKDFWINSRKVQRPGSYMSGDNGTAPLGSTLIEAFKKKQLYKTLLLERPIDLQFIRRTGVSPDSYSSIIRQGNRDGSLRWGEGFTKWNNSAIKNKNIYDAYLQLMEGKISPEQYEGIFNRWSLEIGGRPLLWTTIGELKIPVHPHPYIYAKKQGGKMNILEFLKNGSGIHIKKKNRGKFTSYCGGKVTDECIRKAKASGNPTLVKRATFADNARHFKHKSGGKAFVNGVSVLDSNPDAYKLVKKKVKKAEEGTKFGNWLNNNGTNLLNIGFGIKGIFDASSNLLSNLENAKKQKNLSTLSKLALKMIGADDLVNNIMLYKSLNNPDVHYGIIDYQLEKEKLRKKAYALAANEANEEYTSNVLKFNQEYLNLYNSSMNNILNGLQGILSTLGSKVASNALNKNGTPSSTTGTSLLTGLKNYGTIDNNMNFSTGLGTSFNLLTGASTNYSNKYDNMLLK